MYEGESNEKVAPRGENPSPVSPLVEGERGLYGITVAAELAGSVPQNLRLYEARGLLQPGRSAGGTRRYSDNDVARLRTIVALLDDGLNLAGIQLVLALRATNATLLVQLADARAPTESPPIASLAGSAR